MNECEFLERIISLPESQLSESGISCKKVATPGLLTKTAYFKSGEYDTVNISHIISVYSSDKDYCTEDQLYVISGEGPYKIILNGVHKRIRIVVPDVFTGDVKSVVREIDVKFGIAGVEAWSIATVNENNVNAIVKYLTTLKIHCEDVSNLIKPCNRNTFTIRAKSHDYLNSVFEDIMSYDIRTHNHSGLEFTKVFDTPADMLAQLLEINARSILTNKRDIELVKFGFDLNNHFDLDSMVEIITLSLKWKEYNEKKNLT